jgi:hypothetical protein
MSMTAEVAAAQEREDCLGLACAATGGKYQVPEAKRPVPGVAGPSQLEKQRKAGFYEYGSGTTKGGRAVAYVLPPGQLAAAPASIKRLPVYQDIAASQASAATGTEVIFGPGVSLFVPSAATKARRGPLARMAHGLGDGFNCSDHYFCIYDDRGWYGRRPQFADTGYWQNLGDYGFNDRADSVRNRRHGDSLLAEHAGGGGDRHCFNAQTVVSNFGTLFWWNFGDDASSVYNSTSANRC